MTKDREALVRRLTTERLTGTEIARAVSALVGRFGADVVPQLERAALRDWQVAVDLLGALQKRTDPRVLDLALTLLAKSKSGFAKGAAVRTLARFDEPRAVDALVEAARAGKQSLRLEALSAIEKALAKRRLASAHAEIADAAIDALEVGPLRGHAFLVIERLPPAEVDLRLERARPTLQKLAAKSPDYRQSARALLARLG